MSAFNPRFVRSLVLCATACVVVLAAVAPVSARVVSCPNPDGGSCIGKLKAGTYHTSTFEPSITYRVPSGWSNLEDLPGSFLLVPPSGSLAGANAGTSDYIGVYTSIAAPAAGCTDGYAPGVAHTPKAIARWMGSRTGLITTPAVTTSTGGLHGLRLDIRISPDWKHGCSYNQGRPTVQLIAGVPPSGLVHTMIPHLTIRLYLLSYAAARSRLRLTMSTRAIRTSRSTPSCWPESTSHARRFRRHSRTLAQSGVILSALPKPPRRPSPEQEKACPCRAEAFHDPAIGRRTPCSGGTRTPDLSRVRERDRLPSAAAWSRSRHRARRGIGEPLPAALAKLSERLIPREVPFNDDTSPFGQHCGRQSTGHAPRLRPNALVALRHT